MCATEGGRLARAKRRTAQPQPTMTIAGEVERPQTRALHPLAELGGEETISDLRCHEGWSRRGRRHRGVDCFLSVKNGDRIELTLTPQPASGPSIALARIARRSDLA